MSSVTNVRHEHLDERDETAQNNEPRRRPQAQPVGIRGRSLDCRLLMIERPIKTALAFGVTPGLSF